MKKHKCTGFRDGDWLIFKCPDCDYEFRENLLTQQVKIKGASAEVNHSGVFAPPNITIDFKNISIIQEK